jgi:oligopeptide/dipeptide ABC transporter ATP-binding protein
LAAQADPVASWADRGGRQQTAPEVVLRTRGLSRDYVAGAGLLGGAVRRVEALVGLDLEMRRGEVLALAGESGSGKTTAARLLLGLERPSAGGLQWFGSEVAGRGRAAWLPLRRRVQLLTQDPGGGLDPLQSVGGAIREAPLAHGLWAKAEAPRRARECLDAVGLAALDPGLRPHQLSGGQKQRVALARALALGPEVMVADEPTSALDSGVAAQILNLFLDLRDARGLTWLLVLHDLAAVRDVVDRVAVLFAGRVVESGPARAVVEGPLHPYTRELVAAAFGPGVTGAGQARGDAWSGPAPGPWSQGCRFRARCPHVMPRCGQGEPPEVEQGGGRRVRCRLY